MNVLVVEDEKNTLDSYKMALSANNHKVVALEDGIQALKIYENEFANNNGKPFDVIILDYKLPKMSGLEVAEKILQKNKDQNIIFASAFLEQLIKKSTSNLKKAHSYIDYISKPFDIDDLLEKIELIQLSQEISEFNVKINPDIIKENKDMLKEILDSLKQIEEKYLKEK